MDLLTFAAAIITDLGGELIDVELTESAIEHAFIKAKRVHQQKGNNNHVKAFERLSVVSYQTLYDLTPSINECIRFIKPSSGHFVQGDAFSISLYDSFFNPSSDGTGLASYELILQKLERIQRYTAYDTQFIFDRRNHQIQLLDLPKRSEYWLIECYKDLSDDEYRELHWIYEYSLAEAKLQLGNAYRKFQSLPGPSGEVSMSGDQMVAEAIERKRELEEEIKHFTDGEATGLPILLG